MKLKIKFTQNGTEEVQKLEIENVSTVAEHREHLRNELTQKEPKNMKTI